MRVLVTGGGTGGHIYPAISIANKIKSELPESEILYVGTGGGLEADLVPKEGIDFKTVRVKGFRRKLSLDTVKSLTELALGLNDARRIIKRYRPDVVVGTGGYVCGPIVLLAALSRVPTLIHEQNAFPGVTNKILARFVSRIACSFEEARKYFNYQEKIVVTGNPIRESILAVSKEDSYRELDISASNKTVLSFGGSGGQRSLNEAMLEYIDKNRDSKDVNIIHITGKRFKKSFDEQMENRGLEHTPDNIRVMEYCYDLPKYLSIADLVITSAGAITIAEITALGIPSIIVPKKNTAENHQEYNARALEKRGAARVFLEDDLDPNLFSEQIDRIIEDKAVLEDMGTKSKDMGITDAAERIFKIITEISK